MSLWHIAWSYLWNRKLTTILTILSVALAVGLISSVLTLREETRKRFEEEGQAFDLVVGAKGSPLQLVLSSVYYMDNPTGNILYSDYERLLDEDEVVAAFPISMGDSYKGFRMVGTVSQLFDHTWIHPFTGEERVPFQLADGKYFVHSAEAVLGATVARQTGLKVGDIFHSTHGFLASSGGLAGMNAHVHDDYPYTVVGILKPSGTPNDRVLFCNLQSVWETPGHSHGDMMPRLPGEDLHDEDEDHEAHDAHDDHEGHDHAESEACDEHGHAEDDSLMVTAVLLNLESPTQRFEFKGHVNDNYNAMAATPVEEIATLYDQLLGTAKAVLLAVGYLVVVISALSILIGLYLSILQRKRDMAVMRALGASAYEIFGAVLIEAFWVTVLGIASGWLVGSVVSMALGVVLSQRFGMTVSGFVLTSEMVVAFATVGLVGLLAGIVPAWQAYRTDVARDLAEL